jgi:hypothetical protein
VLIVNWDAANGDPDFGADLTLRWFEHRQPEILLWVRSGGVLIVEGQARLGVPVQRVYDALLGPGEVLVSGPEDGLDPRRDSRRAGKRCQLTARAAASPLFGYLADTLAPSDEPRWGFDDLFPDWAGRVLSPDVRSNDWNVLYRGWFRKNPLPRGQLKWIPLLVTGDGFWRHATLSAAAVGDGAIFASTMFLASTGQDRLVEALLRCHRSYRTSTPLPQPSPHLTTAANRATKGAFVAGVGAAAHIAFTVSPPVPLQEVSKLAIDAAAGIAFAALVILYARLKTALRAYWGW